MGEIIQFPKSSNLQPHIPEEEVRDYLAEAKKDALLRSRVPGEIADLIAQIARASNTTTSGLTRMVMTGWAMKQGVHCPPDGPQTEKAA